MPLTPASIRSYITRLTDPAEIHQALIDYDFAAAEVKRGYDRILRARTKFADALYDKYDALDMHTRSWGDFMSEEDWTLHCMYEDALKDAHRHMYEIKNPPPHNEPAPVADTPSSHNLVLAWAVTILVAVAGFALFK